MTSFIEEYHGFEDLVNDVGMHGFDGEQPPWQHQLLAAVNELRSGRDFNHASPPFLAALTAIGTNVSQTAFPCSSSSTPPVATAIRLSGPFAACWILAMTTSAGSSVFTNTRASTVRPLNRMSVCPRSIP